MTAFRAPWNLALLAALAVLTIVGSLIATALLWAYWLGVLK